MRTMASMDGLHVHAIAGSHVVTFGFDWPGDRAGELQGFAIHRTDHATGRARWLDAQKRYQSTDPGTRKGELVSTLHHPVQSFLWADYTVDPGAIYTYRIMARGGMPDALTALAEVSVEIRTIARTGSGHVVHFNRGAVAAQEYARRFENRPPDDVPNGAALRWLSRGLLESFLAFVGTAQAGDALRVAIYEARYRPALEALAGARRRGVDVRIVYDAKENGDDDEPAFPREDNIDMLQETDLLDVAIAREQGTSNIAHNKFVVLVRDGGPAALWTGSTNWSENGFFGQLNVGHEIHDPETARQFLEYWERLALDPAAGPLRSDLSNSIAIPATWATGCTPVFSPRQQRDALDRYIAALDDAPVVLVTLAFSIDEKLGRALAAEGSGLRYVLMDGIKGNKAQVAKIRQAVKDVRASESGRVAIGAYLRGNALDQFLLERNNAMAKHVQFIHTKFMLVDPLGSAPLVISGSANFSVASCIGNDENMLVIAGDTEVADIYLGEFMRSYSHYVFRDAINAARLAGRPFQPKPLSEDRTWAAEHYGDGFRSRQRRYFARGVL
jgi:phosphatidylserine/phosphatidylglycerophosphate/cardiolipin synthase-like enzyme